jgi:hypothetical protein
MAKNRRVEIRLNEEDYHSLLARADQYGESMTGAIERLLHMAVPVGICGVREVGSRGRRRFSLRFSNGMIVHGFLWSRGHQLLGPRVQVFTETGPHWSRLVDGPREFWQQVRELCEDKLEIEPTQDDPVEALVMNHTLAADH